ncbi:MAG: PD-(D/E)XK motif protein [Aphanocapsa feldmannii 277cI]|uniref:PD-(D/E)XK motif protein n=1 Tax=Aphanocapsa feldmannii 277cI TaxID=2507554 RepID=A0A524RVT9_9CHRO|nr:MAG: PD-(D/E)XK motif protein [Aphanocapsa feldmannii 277cI]
MLAVWDEIERVGGAAAPGVQAKPLVVDGLKDGDILLCIQEGGIRGILLHNPGGRTPLPNTGVGRLHLVRQQFCRPGEPPKTYIRIDCLDKDLKIPFGFLANLVVDHLISGATPTRACLEAVRDFRRLLSRSGGPLPSQEEILGLTGELLLLDRLVRHRPDLWRGWNGPTGSTCDYTWGTTDIEVKASDQSGESRLTINGLNQLEPAEDRSLFIYHSILSPNPIGTIAVPQLADGIRAVVSESEEFDERLAQAGYLPEQRELWEEQRFTLHQTAMYAVTDEFPRIRRSSFPDGCLPPGITRLRFDVLLASASHLRLSEAGLTSTIRSME